MPIRADIEKLIELNLRRLQKLKEQQALKGLNTPPEVLIEIEDIEAQLEQLQTHLSQVIEADRAAEATLYILASIRGSWSAGSYGELAHYKKLEAALKRVSRPDEAVFTSVAELRHDTPQLRRPFAENEPRPVLAGIAFVDLAQPGAQILEDMALVRTYLPAVVFILYTSGAEYKRFKDEAPPEWAGQFEHYYKLRKGGELVFEAKVREILDIARATALQKKEAETGK
ncbi:MAG: hypothetical protein KJ077_30295 [Anaerolineae bacterium]|nr:hypothetical protein [Anaerolineae bacterium]